MHNIPKGLLDAVKGTIEASSKRSELEQSIYNEELAKTGKALEQLTFQEKNELIQTVQNRVNEAVFAEKTKALGHTKDLKGGVKKDTDGAHDHNPVDHQAGIEQPEDDAKRTKRDVKKSRHPLEDGELDDEQPHKQAQATTATEETCVHHGEENCKKCSDK